MVIVLVGKYMASATGVAKEIWNAITSEIDKVMKEGKNAKEINWGFIGVVVGIAVIIGIILGNKKA